MCAVTHSYVTWLLCDMPHSYMWHSFILWHDVFICDMTHSYVTWLIHMWHDSVHVWRDTFIRVTWLIHSCVCVCREKIYVFKLYVHILCHICTWYLYNTCQYSDIYIIRTHTHCKWVNQSRHICLVSHVAYNLVTSHMNGTHSTWHVAARPQLIGDTYMEILRGTGVMTHVTWLIHMLHHPFKCDMTHSYVTWLIHMLHDPFKCDMTHSYVTWLIHMLHDSFICDMTHSYVTWLIHMLHDPFICDMTHSYVTWPIHVWQDWCVTCFIHMWHDSFICYMTHSYVTGLMCDMPHSYLWHSFIL